MATKTPHAASESVLPIRIILLGPPKDVVYGIQRGSGAVYDVDFAQTPTGNDVTFDFTIIVKKASDGAADFKGGYVQGPRGRRFIYVDVGRYARQHNTGWARRMIVRLTDITWAQIESAMKPRKRLKAALAGTHADGGPNCATVVPLKGWKVVSD